MGKTPGRPGQRLLLCASIWAVCILAGCSGGGASRTGIDLINTDGSLRTHFTAAGNSSAWGPDCSPNGQLLAFTITAQGKSNGQLWAVGLDGSRRQLTD